MKDYKTLYSDRIKALIPNINAADKLHTMEKVEISRPTLDKYLKGQIVKQDTAISIIEVLTERINGRYNSLKAIQIN